MYVPNKKKAAPGLITIRDRVGFCSDAERAEMMACKQGLLVARDTQVQQVILETHSVEVTVFSFPQWKWKGAEAC
jgi:ribonuclease HI